MSERMSILAPHKDQDGWVYWRTASKTAKPANMPDDPAGAIALWQFHPDGKQARMMKPSAMKEGGLFIGYDDRKEGSRVISSRRVEKDVETGDFLKKCAERDLRASYDPSTGSEEHQWTVESALLPDELVESVAYGPTLREAYFRYMAAAR